jgi:hypothetical protein
LFCVLSVWWCFSFGPDGLVFCKLPIPGWLFLRLRKFSNIILLNMLSMPSVCNSSYTPMIHRFGLFMVFQISCMFQSYFLSIFSCSFTIWSNSYTLSSVLDTIFSDCSTLFSKLMIVIFIWNTEYLFWGFSGFPCIYWFPLSYPG